MSNDVDDFFGSDTPDGPQRDRWGRPMLLPRGAEERVPYTRASSLADYLADFSHIWKWKMRYLAREMGQTRSRDLAAIAGSESYHTGLESLDPKEKSASGRRLDDIIERLLDRAHIAEKADYGTVVHAITEPGNDADVSWFWETDQDKASFDEKVKEIGATIIGTELFTANDDLHVAGTFDHLKYIPGYGICITDKKTSTTVHPEDFRIQLSTYANADLYDWATDTRMTLEEYVESQGWDPRMVNRKEGLIFWIKHGVTKIIRLDLDAGYEAARHAAWVRDHHRKGKHGWPADSDIADRRDVARTHLLDLIAEAPSEEALVRLWNTKVWQSIWATEHTTAAKARKEAL